jgi:folate-dependent phosphoribosylglycinamide formyltransferase PurN
MVNIKSNKKWVTLFSMTGTEIYNISKKINRVPDVIITNKPVHDASSIKPELFEEYGTKFVWLPPKPSVAEYINAIPRDSFVTLHGWLRIIPPEICEKYEIYNLHPAPIHIEGYDKYKGKDPQVRIFEDKAKYSGNVIHECIPELDAGKILEHNHFDVRGFDLDMVFKLTHSKATELWCGFLENRV